MLSTKARSRASLSMRSANFQMSNPRFCTGSNCVRI